ncbi:MAG TPA: (2Fe-2S)-binding protein [Gemmatimonas aurantiaca]|uniref:Oxidoreductase n=2 Tax=Gemmatimonas aurantiaca TaxID=173480 RepID=C1AAC2_GEMAT|nr:(2Fe-2S)-binding protein [Gemmatimonas aurantiaca]BAH39720.1 oxidoreductase [Gemmatimonas aurantiaca T-27]HCT58270.1 (2Fe-2S)-binding protein [Gemmatimonas aurantiaca]
MAVSLTVNGKIVRLDLPPETPLLWALRDDLDLVGAKFGCGRGQCGACTVQVNGSIARSCTTLLGRLEGARVTTIEGLSVDGSHPLQRAWCELDVAQCGYCQAGQIMAASVLLSRTPQPTDAEIDAAMSGNLCRCATYHRIRAAIHRVTSSGATTGSPSTSPSTSRREDV